MNIFKHLVGVGALALIFCAGASADTLELKDGRVIRGRYLGGTRVIVRFEVEGDVQTFRVSEVAAVRLDRRSGRDRDDNPPPSGHDDEHHRQIRGGRTMRVVRHRTMVLMGALTGRLTGRMMRHHLRRIRGGPTIIRHLRLHRTEIAIETEIVTAIMTVTGMANHIITCMPRLELRLRCRPVKLFWCG